MKFNSKIMRILSMLTVSAFTIMGASHGAVAKVTLQKVSFHNKLGINLVGNIRYPDGFDKSHKYPAIITVPPAGGAKEQTAGLYAQKMAEKGYVTLTMDASFQGESGGTPRFKEDPITRVEDIRSAVDYLVSQSFVDENRIGVLGICAGGGYSVSASMSERRIKAAGVVAPVNAGREMRAGGAEATIASLEAVAKQRTAEAQGEAPMIIPFIPDEYKTSDDIDLREAWQYYRTERGAVPNWQNKMRFTSMDAVTVFDAFYLSDSLLTQPLQIIVGSKQGAFGSNKDGHDLYQRAASTHKDLMVLDGASHFDLYDKPEYVNQAVTQLTKFYAANLK
ncbi:alpha/beta hydrolase [Dickeya chrysanthemi]|uniref:alpha/beta hydrolase n=1 Tax=Dickeya chrysanthemi TaxID=556 RepID=UPI0030195AD2